MHLVSLQARTLFGVSRHWTVTRMPPNGSYEKGRRVILRITEYFPVERRNELMKELAAERVGVGPEAWYCTL